MTSEVVENIVLRVIGPDNVRKLKLNTRPPSVEVLINILKENLEIDNDFTLLYEDPDFDGKLTSLVSIDELPQKAIVYVQLSEDSSFLASTDILSNVASSERLTKWPTGPFPIPTFGFDVELMLRDGNIEFEKNGTHLKLSRDQRHDILEKMASTIYGFKAYQNGKELANAAASLVEKHPCLKEKGCGSGYDGWTNSIKYKMANFRTKMRKAGCPEVLVNAGKRSRSNPDGESLHSNIKKPKRAEVNFLPNYPQGEDAISLENHRQTIVEEMKKLEKNLILITTLMQTTFALRRQTIVVSAPPVKELLELWPALNMQSEVYAEFQRITNVNLQNTFYAELDRQTPRLMSIFRQKASKTGKIADALADIFAAHDQQEQHDVYTRRATLLHALPVFLREDPSGVFITCMDDMEEEVDLLKAAVALLSKVSDTAISPVYHPVKVSVILEGEEVISFKNFPEAFLVMFGLIYALHLTYPRALKHTFEFVQKIILGLDDGKLSPRLQNLTNDLVV